MACQAVARSKQCSPADLGPPALCYGAAARSRYASSEGWWSRRVTLPHQLACRASALLVCHDPVRFMIYDFRFTTWQAAVVLPHTSGVLETRLHRLVRGLLTFARHAQQIIVNGVGAAAGSCARTFALARRHSAVKSQPRKLNTSAMKLLGRLLRNRHLSDKFASTSNGVF